MKYLVETRVEQGPIRQAEVQGPPALQTEVRGPATLRVEMAAVRGLPGPAGPQGDQGPDGLTGQNGAKRWYGEGVPGTIIGSMPGDEYVDTLTGDLYVLT